ncbi:MAG TPA: MOP flippase family protein [Burkholderiales bacterium]|nr:MOP flippase family protein [Burkholderiales bacterium]
MSLRRTAISGVKWSSISHFGRRGLSLLSTIILARLLAPADFGLVAMAAVAIGFIELFKDLGTATAVIQRKDPSQGLLASVFWLNVGFGLAAAMVLYLLAPLLGAFYREPQVIPIMRMLSLSFLLSGLSILQSSLLERDLEFDKLARIEIGAALFATLVGIAAALLGYGAWSIVCQMLAGNFAATLLFWIASRWHPSWEFDWAEVRSVMGFSLNLTGASIFIYFARNADKFLIGRFLGSQDLGYYDLAYRLMQLPLQGISAVISRVMFPLYSRMQDDTGQFGRTYLKVASAIALVSFPLMLGLTALAEPFVLTMFGAAWTPVIPLLLILAPLGALQSVTTTVGTIYTAKGRTDLALWWTIGAGLLFVLSFVLGLPWGILGVTVSYASMFLLLTYPTFAIPFRLIGLEVRDLVGVLWRPAACSLVMYAVVAGTALVSPPGVPHWLTLALLVPLGAVVYCAGSWAINRALLLEVTSILKGKG